MNNGGEQSQQHPADPPSSGDPQSPPSHDSNSVGNEPVPSASTMPIASPAGNGRSPPSPTSNESAGDASGDGSGIGAIMASLVVGAAHSSAVGGSDSDPSPTSPEPAGNAPGNENGIGPIIASLAVEAAQSSAAVDPLMAAIGDIASSVNQPSQTTNAGGAGMVAQMKPVTTLSGGQIFSALASGSSVILAVSGSTTAITAGQTVHLGGVTVAASGASAIAVNGGPTIPLPQAVHAGSDPAASPDQGDPTRSLAIESLGIGGLLLSQGTFTATLAAGQQTTFAGHTISAPSGTGVAAVVVDGQTTSLAGSAVTVMGPAQSLAIYESAGALIANEGSSVVTLTPGGETIFAGHTISAAVASGVVVLDGRPTTIMAADPALAMYESAGDLIASEGSSVATLTAGEQTTFGGHTISAAVTSGVFVLDGTSTTVASADSALAVYESAGALIASEGSSSITLTPGAQTTFAGHSLSAAAGSNVVVVDGTRTSSAGTAPSLAVFESGSVLLASEGSSSITLTPGEQTTFAGHSLSAATGSNIVMIDGTRTATLQASSKGLLSGASVSSATETSAPGISGTSSTTTASAGTRILRGSYAWMVFVSTLAVLIAR